MSTAFDDYFRDTDLDHGGRISGEEAITFFKCSGLPQLMLAQLYQKHSTDATTVLA